jgi:hypothetical protein
MIFPVFVKRVGRVGENGDGSRSYDDSEAEGPFEMHVGSEFIAWGVLMEVG